MGEAKITRGQFHEEMELQLASERYKYPCYNLGRRVRAPECQWHV